LDKFDPIGRVFQKGFLNVFEKMGVSPPSDRLLCMGI
jgi:hypothetical protein